MRDQLLRALDWGGASEVIVPMFALTRDPSPEKLVVQLELVTPGPLRFYELEDEALILNGRSLFEIDLVLRDIPYTLDELLTTCLTSTVLGGAELTWFGFEGSFDFGTLLQPEIAEQIFAVGDSEGLLLATDDVYRSSDGWKYTLAQIRCRHRLPAASK